jgi:hypothetical protein
MTTIKQWLDQNNYGDVLKKITAVEKGWEQKGTKTRRDWGDVLAGNKNGTPKEIEGVRFPILCAAQKRKGWPTTKNCLCKNPDEEMPAIAPQGRWEKLSRDSQVRERRPI